MEDYGCYELQSYNPYRPHDSAHYIDLLCSSGCRLQPSPLSGQEADRKVKQPTEDSCGGPKA